MIVDDFYLTVSEIMSPEPYTIDSSEPVSEAAKLMSQKAIGSLIVTQKEKAVGIITERDLMIKVVALDLKPSKTFVGDIMSFPLIYLAPDVTVEKLAKMFSRLEFRRMPIIKDDKLLGLVTDRDLVRRYPNLLAVCSGEDIGSQIEDIEESRILRGPCDSCRNFSSELIPYEDRYLCKDCIGQM